MDRLSEFYQDEDYTYEWVYNGGQVIVWEDGARSAQFTLDDYVSLEYPNDMNVLERAAARWKAVQDAKFYSSK